MKASEVRHGQRLMLAAPALVCMCQTLMSRLVGGSFVFSPCQPNLMSDVLLTQTLGNAAKTIHVVLRSAKRHCTCPGGSM